ncbi:hypothetical protein F4054_19845 [Candidatus Poribacteria bacterium]|nr:hypothetical protein [Candidatus Poribacteria bacterium]MYK24500.1 hypothetical protein [Candidatus Poribacteria bacterium]
MTFFSFYARKRAKNGLYKIALKGIDIETPKTRPVGAATNAGTTAPTPMIALLLLGRSVARVVV